MNPKVQAELSKEHREAHQDALSEPPQRSKGPPIDFDPDWRKLSEDSDDLPEDDDLILLYFKDGDIETWKSVGDTREHWEGYDLTHWAPFTVKPPEPA